jgi:hypothetical protein
MAFEITYQTMLPNEILPAIPRQKVKNTGNGYEKGQIGDVLLTCISDYSESGTHDSLLVKNLETGEVRKWDMNDCEPVPEEPRKFRVGDNVKCLNTSVFSTIKNVRIAENGWPEQYVVDEFWQTKENMRHATPQECKDYFN